MTEHLLYRKSWVRAVGLLPLDFDLPEQVSLFWHYMVVSMPGLRDKLDR